MQSRTECGKELVGINHAWREDVEGTRWRENTTRDRLDANGIGVDVRRVYPRMNYKKISSTKGKGGGKEVQMKLRGDER